MLQLRNLLGALRQAVNTLFPRNQAPHDLDLNRASLPSNSKEGIGPQVWAYLDRPLGEFHRPATGSEVRRLGLDPALHRRTVSELKGFWSKRFPLTASYSSMRFLANILEAIATIEP
ncbi:MAG: hypothetical protein K1X83_11690 [Oligoflexia bacterium]|nr:hypothetical protein [Oligoflexia bacterium]